MWANETLIGKPAILANAIYHKLEIIPEGEMYKMKMTEEEGREIWNIVNRGGGFERFISTMKKEGYIARPIWEEAEEYYHRWLPMPKNTVSDYYSMVDKFHDALLSAVDRIRELEEKAKIDEKRCPMCGKIHRSDGAVCPACENDPRN